MYQLVVSEKDKIAALMENGKAVDFFVNRNDLAVGDVYTVFVENVMPSIDAVFVNLGGGRMGFLHANDVPGSGDLRDRMFPGQKLLVQIVKEPTGKKGPRVDLEVSIPGRYFVLSSENHSVSVSRKISNQDERNRLKTIATLMKPEEVGIVIRTEAAGHSEAELEEDFVDLWAKWRNIIDKHESTKSPSPVFKDQDFLYSILRDSFNNMVDEIVVDNLKSKARCDEYLKSWTQRNVTARYIDSDKILEETGVAKELKGCLSNRADLPSGGYVIIQTTEALTAIDINSGRFTSSNTLQETVRRTNMEAAVEIARQMKLRNIGGMIIVDFIDMYDRGDRIKVMETLERAVKTDKANPQVGQLSDLCLTEITRKRSGQALREIFGVDCPHCEGLGVKFSLRGHSHEEKSSSGGRRFDRSERGGRDRDSRGGRDRGGRDRDSRGGRDRGGRDSRGGRDNRGGRDRDRSDSKSSSRENSRASSAKTASSEAPIKKESSTKETKDLSKSKTFAATHMAKEPVAGFEPKEPKSKEASKPGKTDSKKADTEKVSKEKPKSEAKAKKSSDSEEKSERRTKVSKSLQKLIKKKKSKVS